MKNPTTQIAVPQKEIVELINPAIPFTTAKIAKSKH